jgi:hypothetical protein
MRSATAVGCETATEWEASISSIARAPARCAMKRCASGWIIRSRVPTMAHDGSVFQAATCARSSNTAANERLLEGCVREAAEDLGKGLVFIEDERGDVDESDDIGRTSSGDGDHGATVRVAHKDDGAVDLVHDARDVGRVTGEAAQRVREARTGRPLACSS